MMLIVFCFLSTLLLTVHSADDDKDGALVRNVRNFGGPFGLLGGGPVRNSCSRCLRRLNDIEGEFIACDIALASAKNSITTCETTNEAINSALRTRIQTMTDCIRGARTPARGAIVMLPTVSATQGLFIHVVGTAQTRAALEAICAGKRMITATMPSTAAFLEYKLMIRKTVGLNRKLMFLDGGVCKKVLVTALDNTDSVVGNCATDETFDGIFCQVSTACVSSLPTVGLDQICPTVTATT